MSASRPSTRRRPGAFVPLADEALYALAPEELLAYIAAAKRAGVHEHAESAVHMLLFREESRMRIRIAMHLPAHLRHHESTVAEWVLDRVMRAALKLQFEGESVGEWVNWMKTTIRRQVVSFWRSPQGKLLERERMLDSEHEGTDGVQDRLGTANDEDRLVSRLDTDGAIEAVRGRMSNPAHIAIVDSAFWEDRPSRDIAEAHGTTVANVDQIKSRFRKELRAELIARGITEP
jgi:DNA-directed RNA polymerase specialized sigma24 family protein